MNAVRFDSSPGSRNRRHGVVATWAQAGMMVLVATCLALPTAALGGYAYFTADETWTTATDGDISDGTTTTTPVVGNATSPGPTLTISNDAYMYNSTGALGIFYVGGYRGGNDGTYANVVYDGTTAQSGANSMGEVYVAYYSTPQRRCHRQSDREEQFHSGVDQHAGHRLRATVRMVWAQ